METDQWIFGDRTSLLPAVPVTVEAILSGCDTLRSEDLHHKMTVDDRLRLVTPYRQS